jgi:hypothetical protein
MILFFKLIVYGRIGKWVIVLCHVVKEPVSTLEQNPLKKKMVGRA